MDAGFFFERAVSSLDRFHYDKALKYFGKAVEYEPENPVNHCNMAGILSEMGDYQGSNDILHLVLKEIDPLMTECYFYLANNYANMEQFEQAEEALITYLEEDASGQFMTEAEEMMELLHFELKRPAELRSIKSRQGMVEHERARTLLEEGKFTHAVQLLEEIVEKHEDFLAARNNLALAYYYLGRFAKAQTALDDVLDREPGNLHGLCNLVIFYQHLGREKELKELTAQLRTVVPFHQEHVFKLATTMGILGEHEAAYSHFKRLIKDMELNHDPCLFHYTAVAAYNTGRYKEARIQWNQVARLDPESKLSSFYLSRLDSLPETKGYLISYNYHLPFEEQFKRWETHSEDLPEGLTDDPLIRSSFLWALRNGDSRTKIQVLQAFGWIGDEEALESLRAFLLEPDEDIYLKEIALFVLRNLDVEEDLPLMNQGKIEQVNPMKVRSSLPEWDSQWQRVLDLALRSMSKRYELTEQHDLEILWIQFITKMDLNMPPISKAEVWSAALEYLTAKMHGRSISYEQAASRYGVSSPTVSKYVKLIDQTCGIDHKMKAILPSPFE
nr:tetratricopeptide repeat protein [Paenibacillus shirakamiensis]